MSLFRTTRIWIDLTGAGQDGSQRCPIVSDVDAQPLEVRSDVLGLQASQASQVVGRNRQPNPEQSRNADRQVDGSKRDRNEDHANAPQSSCLGEQLSERDRFPLRHGHDARQGQANASLDGRSQIVDVDRLNELLPTDKWDHATPRDESLKAVEKATVAEDEPGTNDEFPRTVERFL
jgi:hypothetical protein